ncbi:MAG: hypothetical protein AAB410_02785 [Patescibacteria group bacterium]
MSGLIGEGVREPNIVLRFCIIIFLGVLGTGIVLSWKASVLMAAEYQEMPKTRKNLEIKKSNQKKQREILHKQLKNY